MNHTGSCLCGAVRFEVTVELPPPDACHCTQCRKFSGHFYVSADIPKSALKVHGEEHVTWFQSSAKARRGFCAKCGSSLFWDPIGREWTAVALGAIDGHTKTHIKMHIFTAEKGDYYDITGEAPQYPKTPH